MKHLPLLLILLAGCTTVPDGETHLYQHISKLQSRPGLVECYTYEADTEFCVVSKQLLNHFIEKCGKECPLKQGK